MKTHVILVVAVIAACVLPAIAQSGGSPDALGAILVELRALRIAVERATTTTPQVQLLAARLTVQNERVSRASRDADAVHQELASMEGAQAMFTAQIADIEDKLSRETQPTTVTELKTQQRALKEQLDGAAAGETRLRAREADLANVLAVEQTQWTELNRRLDDLERQLAARRPQ
jgi:predicted  nucleic acid-binding Zn-ribbon protein